MHENAHLGPPYPTNVLQAGITTPARPSISRLRITLFMLLAAFSFSHSVAFAQDPPGTSPAAPSNTSVTSQKPVSALAQTGLNAIRKSLHQVERTTVVEGEDGNNIQVSVISETAWNHYGGRIETLQSKLEEALDENNFNAAMPLFEQLKSIYSQALADTQEENRQEKAKIKGDMWANGGRTALNNAVARAKALKNKQAEVGQQAQAIKTLGKAVTAESEANDEGKGFWASLWTFIKDVAERWPVFAAIGSAWVWFANRRARQACLDAEAHTDLLFHDQQDLVRLRQALLAKLEHPKSWLKPFGYNPWAVAEAIRKDDLLEASECLAFLASQAERPWLPRWLDGVAFRIASINIRMAEVDILRNKLDEASHALEKARDVLNRNGSKEHRMMMAVVLDGLARASLFFGKGGWRQAIAYYQEALDIFPRERGEWWKTVESGIRYHLALAYQADGQTERAAKEATTIQRDMAVFRGSSMAGNVRRWVDARFPETTPDLADQTPPEPASEEPVSSPTAVTEPVTTRRPASAVRTVRPALPAGFQLQQSDPDEVLKEQCQILDKVQGVAERYRAMRNAIVEVAMSARLKRTGTFWDSEAFDRIRGFMDRMCGDVDWPNPGFDLELYVDSIEPPLELNMEPLQKEFLVELGRIGIKSVFTGEFPLSSDGRRHNLFKLHIRMPAHSQEAVKGYFGKIRSMVTDLEATYWISLPAEARLYVRLTVTDEDTPDLAFSPA